MVGRQDTAWLEAKTQLSRQLLVPGARARALTAGRIGPENVVGVGVEEKLVNESLTGENSLKVYVVEKLPREVIDDQFVVPEEFMGLPTDVEAVGELIALQASQPRQQRAVAEAARKIRVRRACQEPVPGGVSVGHVAITAGTLGVVATYNGNPVILSNNHVLANSNQAQVGDFIVQPGPYDGGTHSVPTHPGHCGVEDDCVGTLLRFVPIDFSGGPNKVDAALASPLEGARALDPDILGIGPVTGTVRASLNMYVRKAGRTTGLTDGVITSTNTDVKVSYPPFTAVFEDQIIVRGLRGAFSDGGDSGSLLVDSQNRAVGLLFAGSRRVTILNHVSEVVSALGITIP